MNKNKAPAMASPPQPGGPGPLSGPGDNLDMIAQPMFPILTDPMTDMLAPGDLKQESEDLSIPDEIKALFDMHGLSKKGFRSMLKQLPEGVEDTAQGVYVKSWSRSFPSTDWIALNYGPGTYELCFQFKGYVEGKMANQTERIIINISDKLADEHEEFIFRKKLKRSEERRKQISNAKLHKQLDFDMGDDKKESVEGIPTQMMQMVQQFSTIATALGFNRGGGTDWGKILASALPLLPAVMGYLSQKSESEQARQREFMTLLISTMSSNNTNMLDIVKAQSGVGSGQNAVKEFKDMLMGVVDIKKSLSEGQENSVADRIFSMIETVAPSIISMATMSKEKRQNLPQYGMAQTMMQINPDLRKLREDPAVLAQVIARWDGHFGWRQGDMILEVAELARPPQCPRNPWQEFEAGSPRNPPPPNQPIPAQEVLNESAIA